MAASSSSSVPKVWAELVTPVDARGVLLTTHVSELVEFYATAGVDGLVVSTPSLGENSSLRSEERVELAAAVVAAAKAVSEAKGKALSVAVVGSEAGVPTERMAAEAKKLAGVGVDAVLISIDAMRSGLAHSRKLKMKREKKRLAALAAKEGGEGGGGEASSSSGGVAKAEVSEDEQLKGKLLNLMMLTPRVTYGVWDSPSEPLSAEMQVWLAGSTASRFSLWFDASGQVGGLLDDRLVAASASSTLQLVVRNSSDLDSVLRKGPAGVCGLAAALRPDLVVWLAVHARDAAPEKVAGLASALSTLAAVTDSAASALALSAKYVLATAADPEGRYSSPHVVGLNVVSRNRKAKLHPSRARAIDRALQIIGYWLQSHDL